MSGKNAYASSRSRVIAVSLLGVMLLVLSAGSALAAQRIMFIFDASGSMWGQIDGKAKIEIAREAFADLIRTVPDDAEVGLVAYGHRVKGDCADIETVAPMAPLDRQGLAAAVNGLNPKGMTPMADSIRMVAEELKASEERATIILISDGKETCDPDPCATVAMLKDAGIDFVMHVIGFDVGGDTEEQLRCMAQAGGGEYFPAKNAAELGRAAQEVMELTGDNLEVSATRDGKVLHVDVYVMPAGSSEVLANRWSTDDEPAGFRLEPGMYDLRIVDAWVQVDHPEMFLANVEVAKDQVREVAVSFDGATLEVQPYSNGKPYHAYVSVDDAQGNRVDDKASYEDGPAVFELQPGTYHVTVKDEWGTGAVVDLGMVEVASGTVTLTASFEMGVLEVWAYANGKPYHAYAYVTDAQGNRVDDRATYEDGPAVFEVLPGTYHVKVVDEWGAGSTVDLGMVEVGTDTTKVQADF